METLKWIFIVVFDQVKLSWEDETVNAAEMACWLFVESNYSFAAQLTQTQLGEENITLYTVLHLFDVLGSFKVDIKN